MYSQCKQKSIGDRDIEELSTNREVIVSVAQPNRKTQRKSTGKIAGFVASCLWVDLIYITVGFKTRLLLSHSCSNIICSLSWLFY